MTNGTLAIVATLVASLGQVSGIGNAKSEALAAFNRLMDAFAMCDLREVDRLTSLNWIDIRLDGRVHTREASMKDTRQRCKPQPATILKDMQVRTYGDDTAVFIAAFVRREGGDVPAGPVRLTDVWVKQEGRWVRVHSHVSRIQQ